MPSQSSPKRVTIQPTFNVGAFTLLLCRCSETVVAVLTRYVNQEEPANE